MHAVDRLDREFLEQPLLDHDAAAALVLLGGLEDEVHGAVEIARLGEILGRAEQHRGVAVVAAGVHAAGVLRAMAKTVLLVDVQRVEVGAQADRALARAGGERADHAGAGEPARHRDAELGQLLGDHVGGAVLLERGLGMGVDVAAPRRHLIVIAGNAIDDRHGRSSTVIATDGRVVAPTAQAAQAPGRLSFRQLSTASSSSSAWNGLCSSEMPGGLAVLSMSSG